MAQPLVPGAQALRISSFCSKNKFTSLGVHNRADTIQQQLNAVGIEMLTYGSDGDSRELKMMRETLRIGQVLKLDRTSK